MLKQIGLIIAIMGVWLTLPAVVGAQAQSQQTINLKINVFRDRNFDNLLNPSREPVLHGWNIEAYDANANRIRTSAQHSTQFLDHEYPIDVEAAYLCVEPIFNWVQTFPNGTSFAHPGNDSWYCHDIDDATDIYYFAVFENGQPPDDGRNLDNSEDNPTQLPPVVTDPDQDTNDDSNQNDDGNSNNDPDDQSSNQNDDNSNSDTSNNSDDTNSNSNDDSSTAGSTDNNSDQGSSDTGGQVLGANDDNQGSVLAENDGDVLAETGSPIHLIILAGLLISSSAVLFRKTRFAYLRYR